MGNLVSFFRRWHVVGGGVVRIVQRGEDLWVLTGEPNVTGDRL